MADIGYWAVVLALAGCGAGGEPAVAEEWHREADAPFFVEPGDTITFGPHRMEIHRLSQRKVEVEFDGQRTVEETPQVFKGTILTPLTWKGANFLLLMWSDGRWQLMSNDTPFGR